MAMTANAIGKFCLTLPSATETIQWKDNRVFKIGGKMFAVCGQGRGARYSFKVERDQFLALTDQPGVIPAPYLAKASWVQIDPSTCELSPAELKRLVRGAYDIVFAGLTKKLQRELG